MARLDQHSRVCHPEEGSSKHKEKITCPDPGCGETFGRIYDLKRHRESVHLKIKNFVCDHCEKRFTDKRDLNRHAQAIHFGIRNGQKNFTCYFCSMEFKRKRDLDAHRAEHMEEEEEFHLEQVEGVSVLEVGDQGIYVATNETLIETDRDSVEIGINNIVIMENDGKFHVVQQGVLPPELVQN